MWVRSTATLNDNLIQLSTPLSSHLLILGNSAALVDASVLPMAERLVSAIEPYHRGDFPLGYVLLTHAHFDHVGALPLLRRAFPDLQLIASPLTTELLQSVPELEKIFERNLACAAATEQPVDIGFEEFRKGLEVNRVVSEGDTIALGDGCDVKVVACPGHTTDTTGYFVKDQYAFAGAESVGGYAGRDKITPCFLSDRRSYTETLDKILALDIRYLGLPHSGALTGELAKRFLQSAREESDRFVEAVRNAVNEGVIREELALDLIGEWTVQGISPEGPFTIVQEEVVNRMVELTLDEMNAAS